MSIQQSIIIKPDGRLANQMIQYMVARCIKERLGEDIQISGYNMPEWGLVQAEIPSSSSKKLAIAGHHFNFSQLIQLLKMRVINDVVITGWGMRLDQFESPTYYSNLFTSTATPSIIHDDEILIHVRAGDILSGWHPRYYPLPLDFYRHIISETGLKPVFMGELDPGEFTDNLKRNFPEARYLPKRSVVEDFQTIRSAKNIVISISTYAWLATWLSDQAQNIHYPVCGLLDPQNELIWLMPVGDTRYHFYKMPFPAKTERDIYGPIHWVNRNAKISKLTLDEAKDHLMFGLYPKKPHSVPQL
jgi:hypothetical protein